MKKTKIVCTIGPAVATPEKLEDLVTAGMDVARLNFSHGKNEEFVAWAKIIRQLAQKYNQPIAIIQDLSGPKLRVGELPPGGIELKTGETAVIPIHYQFLEKDVQPGDRVLLDDGMMEVRVKQVKQDKIEALVISGGHLASHKGVNLPGIRLSCPALTEKDRTDLEVGLRMDADYIALSFVRSENDLIELKNLIAKKIRPRAEQPKVIAKIEKPEALIHFPEIMEAADAILVARGDLGVELPPEKVPVEQKKIIEECLKNGKPVIVATQMLESMTIHPRPTRAEVSDVANAILDGADAVMLSAETSTGRYPIEATKMMVKIIDEVETKLEKGQWLEEDKNQDLNQNKIIADAAGDAVCQTSQELKAKYIVAATFSGKSARLISRHRPSMLILALTPSSKTYSQLALLWGTKPLFIPAFKTTDELITQATELLKKKKLVVKDDVIVIAAGHPLAKHGETNLIKVERI